MKSIRLLKYGQKPIVDLIPIPIPTQDQVLVKVRYAPVNPADVYYSLGVYGVRNTLPSGLGMEGSGEIVGTGEKVCFLADPFNSWSEFIAVKKSNCYPIQDLLQGCMNLINPFTVLGFAELAKQYNSVIFSSNRSATAQMGIKYFQYLNKKVYSFEQSKEIKEATVYFDSLSGDQSGDILTDLPDGSMLVNYGSSSRKHLNRINPNHLIFKNKVIRGFWMSSFYNTLQQSQRDDYVKLILSLDLFRTKIHKVIDMETDIIALHNETRGLGKLVIQL